MEYLKIDLISAIGVVLVAVGTILTIMSGNKSSDDKHKELTTKLEKSEESNENRGRQIDILIETNSKLSIQIENMREEQNKSSVELSSELKSYQDKVVEKDGKIKELEEYIDKIKRGLTKVINFDGSHFIKTGGNMIMVNNTPESMIFQELTAYENNSNYEQLLKLSDQAIVQTKEWYTPYIFKAIALYNINKSNIEEVNKLLDYVEIRTREDIKFQQALITTYNKIDNNEKAKEIESKLDPDALKVQEMHKKIGESLKNIKLK